MWHYFSYEMRLSFLMSGRNFFLRPGEMKFDLENFTVEEKATKILAFSTAYCYKGYLFYEDTPAMKLEEQSACMQPYFLHKYINS